MKKMNKQELADYLWHTAQTLRKQQTILNSEPLNYVVGILEGLSKGLRL